MSIERGQAVILVAGGMLIGAGLTTLILKKHYQKIADLEISSIRQDYIEKSSARNKQLVTEDLIEEVETSFVDVPEDMPYHRMETYDDPHPTSVDQFVDKDLPPTVKPIRPMLGAYDPYVITVDQFMSNEEEYDQITLTFYEGDGQLVNDSDDLIDDVFDRIGDGPLQQFGKMSGNGDTVYVRNINHRVDYEVIRDYRSFGKDMLGIDEPEPLIRVKQPKPPKTPKFRGE